jgi:hypothetical protein
VVTPNTEVRVRAFPRQYRSIEDAMEAMPTRRFVYLVPESDLPTERTPHFRLHEYPHPDEVTYVIGADGGFGFDIPDHPEGDFVIIETPTGLNRSMWSFQVASIVLYDRWLKGRS